MQTPDSVIWSGASVCISNKLPANVSATSQISSSELLTIYIGIKCELSLAVKLMAWPNQDPSRYSYLANTGKFTSYIKEKKLGNADS